MWATWVCPKAFWVIIEKLGSSTNFQLFWAWLNTKGSAFAAVSLCSQINDCLFCSFVDLTPKGSSGTPELAVPDCKPICSVTFTQSIIMFLNLYMVNVYVQCLRCYQDNNQCALLWKHIFNNDFILALNRNIEVVRFICLFEGLILIFLVLCKSTVEGVSIKEYLEEEIITYLSMNNPCTKFIYYDNTGEKKRWNVCIQ